MKSEIKDIGVESVFRIVAEEAGKRKVIIQKRFLSPLIGEELNLLNVDAFTSGLQFALNLLETEKRIRKGEEESSREIITVIPAETAYDDDFRDLVTGAANNSNHLYVCFNLQTTLNGWACSATPMGTKTKNYPLLGVKRGYPFAEKTLSRILADAGGGYVAQTSAFAEDDFRQKLQKALGLKGFRFLNVLTPSHFWGYLAGAEEEIGILSLSTGHFPHFEFENGTLSAPSKFGKLQPLAEYFAIQKRFQHLILPGNRKLFDLIQDRVKKDREELNK